MIEKIVPIQIPPGLLMNGTLNERAGRWSDGDLVRFLDLEGTPVPVGSWSELSTTPAPPAGAPTSAFAWHDTLNPGIWVFVATSSAVYVIRFISGTSRTITTITPAGYTGSVYTATVLGSTLLFMATASSTSKLYKWTTSTVGVATEVTQFTTQHTVGSSPVVTPNNFLVAIKGGVSSNDVVWASQGGFTVWLPDIATNTAGSLTVPTKGALRRLAVVGAQTLLWSTSDLWELEYVGGELVHGLRSVDNKSGILGANTLAVIEGGIAYWMHDNVFYQYDGYVRELPCDISQYVFGDMNRSAASAFFTIHNSTFKEIWWFYCSSGASNPDRVAIYNYLNKTWTKAALARTAGTDAIAPVLISGPNTVKAPLLFHSDDTIYLHEGSGAAAGAYLESGPVFLGDGDQMMKVQKVITDGRTTNDDWTLFYDTDYPGAFSGAESTATGTGGGSDVFDTRFTARYVRYKQTFESASSRIGVPKLGVIPSSRR